jgi:1-deoxy-D-xylulose-5-phosphate reductoisomerase
MNQNATAPRLRVAVLGASGSVGRQTLDVCRQHADKLEVVALSVHSNIGFLIDRVHEFGVKHVVVADADLEKDPRAATLAEMADVRFGVSALDDLCRLDEVDCVLDALVGEVGIGAAYASITADKRLALANKEALVVGGDLLMPLAKPGQMLPVDSEHSAIFQCLVGESHDTIHKIWLTCSGGPFYGMTRAELEHVTAAQALAHPNWKMGPKITIDCATLMNKGLEVLEAHHLFDVAIDDIEVLVHRQSTVHSMVEFADGSTKAQLGPTDMRIPIQYAFSWPDRWETPSERIDYRTVAPMTFGAPDPDTFRCLALALEAGRIGGTMPCVMNAANEIANQAFRDGRIGFCDIDRVVEAVMHATTAEKVESLAQIAQVDAASRAQANRIIDRKPWI